MAQKPKRIILDPNKISPIDWLFMYTDSINYIQYRRLFAITRNMPIEC